MNPLPSTIKSAHGTSRNCPSGAPPAFRSLDAGGTPVNASQRRQVCAAISDWHIAVAEALMFPGAWVSGPE